MPDIHKQRTTLFSASPTDRVSTWYLYDRSYCWKENFQYLEIEVKISNFEVLEEILNILLQNYSHIQKITNS